MNANKFGSVFQVTTFGESHGPALGVVVDGCPAGVPFDQNLLQTELDRRRPGQNSLVTQRSEPDQVEILSGIYEERTLGTPIAMIVRNTNARSSDYKEIATSPRKGHADDVWKEKFGIHDYRGGGRASGRETVARVMAGAIAKMAAKKLAPNLEVKSWVAQVGSFQLTETEQTMIWENNIDNFPLRFPSASRCHEAQALVQEAQAKGDSVGGALQTSLRGVPVGLGQPVFHKLKSDFAAAFMSIGAISGFDLGVGRTALNESGHNFHHDPQSKNYGGIRGGLSTGEEISLMSFLKPTSSIGDVAKKGRHDPFIGTRAVAVVDAMAWLVLVDHLLWARTDRL